MSDDDDALLRAHARYLEAENDVTRLLSAIETQEVELARLRALHEDDGERIGLYLQTLDAMNVEIARLRAIEEAARDIAGGGWLDVDGETGNEWCHWCDGWPKHADGCEFVALRAALGS